MGKELGTRIASALKRQNMMQRELADCIGVSEGVVSRYVTGSRDPKPDVLANIALALRTSADELLGINEERYTRNVFLLADYVVQRTLDKGESITNLKLQKVFYYLQGYSLKYLSECAFFEPIERWSYGPAVPQVYFEYISYGTIPLTVRNPSDLLGIKLSDEQKKLFNRVIDICLETKTQKLVKMSSEEIQNMGYMVYEGDNVPKSAIRDYFLAHNPLNIEERTVWD